MRGGADENARPGPGCSRQNGKEQCGGARTAPPAERHSDRERGVEHEREAVAPERCGGEVLCRHFITPKSVWNCRSRDIRKTGPRTSRMVVSRSEERRVGKEG